MDNQDQFIHDELLRRCARAVEKINMHWRTDRHIYPTLLIWPDDTVMTTDGTRFAGVIFAELPEDVTQRRAFINEAAKKCNAYGLLMTEQLEKHVRVIFESPAGTRTWRFPIKDHGNVQVLGRPEVRNNTESLGVRWHAN